VVPLTKAVLVLNALPPLLAAYHLIEEPVAAKLATVPLLQTVCEVVPVGAEGKPVTEMVLEVDVEPLELVAVS
jgi:hypothetical protein